MLETGIRRNKSKDHRFTFISIHVSFTATPVYLARVQRRIKALALYGHKLHLHFRPLPIVIYTIVAHLLISAKPNPWTVGRLEDLLQGSKLAALRPG